MTSVRLERILLAAGVILYATLAIASLRLESATFDETSHLPVGYTFLALGDYRLDTDDPALARMIVSLPLLFAGVRMDTDDPAWREGQVWRFAHQFMYVWNDADRTLLLGRLMTVALAVLLAIAVFRWARDLAGPGAGLFAFGFCVLNPDILAHGRLATTDLVVTLFFFLTVAGFERLTRGFSWRRLALAGAVLGCALAAKFSAAALLPILFLLAVACAWSAGTDRQRRLALHIGSLVAMLLIAWLVLWAVYRFRFAASPAGVPAPSFEWGGIGRLDVVRDGLLRTARSLHLIPEAYLFGFFDLFRPMHTRVAFLMGEISSTGWWYYLPVTFLLKTPVPLMILLVLPLAGGWRRGLPGRDADGWRTQAFLWIPVVVFTGLALTVRLNIGHRHLLPIYPFLFVAAGRAAAALWTGARPRLTRVAVAGLSAWYVLGTAHVHPHYLAYFNELAGGASGGYRYLVDSNLDWGQSLKQLKAWVEENQVRRIRFSYFGSADPAYYGIPCDYLPGETRLGPLPVDLFVLPGDVVAISATNLQAVYLKPAFGPLMKRFRDMRPVAVLGHSIFIYRPDFVWMIPAEDARQIGWLPQATASYLKILEADPTSVEARGNLGAALAYAGRPREAKESFEAALRADPRYFERWPDRRALYEAARAAAAAAP
jgi:4-amino-4-deoxy-L-arabinose transferase-like glycosyltransferase